jgi:hypothetical protein
MPFANRLDHRFDSRASMGRGLALLVDQTPLLDLLEDAMPRDSRVARWPEKKHARLVIEALQTTLIAPGNYDIWVCSHCGIAEDLVLEPIIVTHQEEYIHWQLQPPGRGLYFDGDHPIHQVFHRAQYAEVITNMLKRDSMYGNKQQRSNR